jgi:5-methyltetrahydrofolate--homocysteine methyltransferase
MLAKRLVELQLDECLNIAQEELSKGTDALEILNECQKGMNEIGARFERNEAFISDLMMSGEIFRQISSLLEPHLQAGTQTSGGIVVLGTVKGDIHDIGKDIVANMLKSAGLQVEDLGVDVPPDRFIDALNETDASVLGMSGLLTTAFEPMRQTIELIDQAGMKDRVHVMIGGGPVNGMVCQSVGADAWGRDAQAAVRIASSWLEGGNAA